MIANFQNMFLTQQLSQKTLSFLSIFGLLIILPNQPIAEINNPLPIIDSDKLNAQIFTDIITDEIPEVKGYSAVVMNRFGETIVSIESGVARTEEDEDGYQAFTADTAIVWASVSKVITTIAVLHAIENTNAKLDDPIKFYLPTDWKDSLHPSFDSVTIRMLLQHRGGFIDNNNDSYAAMKERLAAGIENECDDNNVCGVVGERSYANMNLQLFNVILPYISDSSNMLQLELQATNENNPDNFMSEKVSEAYRNYVREYLFDPLNIDAYCNAGNFNENNNYSLLFANPNDTTGIKPLNFDQTCAAYGWITSTNGIAKLLSTAKHSNEIISQESFSLMENINNPEDALGLLVADFLCNGLTCFKHNGLFNFVNNGEWGYVYTSIVYLPFGYQAVISVNSRDSNDAKVSGLDNSIIYAFTNSMETYSISKNPERKKRNEETSTRKRSQQAH